LAVALRSSSIRFSLQRRNELFAELVGSKNKDVISFAAPCNDIQFDYAVAFWSSFYVKTFSMNAKSMNSIEL